MKPFIAILLGGSHDGQQIAIGADVQHVDMPAASGEEAVRYRRKLWARVVDEKTREIVTDTFYVIDTMSDQEATTALLQHLKAQAAG